MSWLEVTTNESGIKPQKDTEKPKMGGGRDIHSRKLPPSIVPRGEEYCTIKVTKDKAKVA